MKKYFTVCISCAIFISFMLCSCSLESSTTSFANDIQSKSNDLYSVALYGDTESDIFKKEVYKYETDKVIKSDVFEIPVEKDLQIGNFKTTANLVKSEQFENFTKNTYLSIDNTKEYRINTDSTFFQILAKNDAVLSHIGDAKLTEDNLVKHVKAYIKDILGDVDYSKYTYSCSTFLNVHSENGSYGDTRDGFAVSTNENEELCSYKVKFVKYCNGIETIDKITVNCDKKGNITNFWRYNYDMDWDSVEIDQDKVTDSIVHYIQNNTLSKYKVKDFEIESQTLTVKNGEVKLSVTVRLRLTADGVNEYSVLCNFIVDL